MGFSVGGLLGSNSSAKKAASIQQMYTKEQMQNQHQWEMADLKAANLNPALTLGDTSGASGSAGMPNMGGTPEGLSGLLNSAISAYTAKKDAETGETQGQLNLATAANTIAETDAIPEKLKNDTLNALSNQMNAQANKQNAQTNSAVAKERINTDIQERYLKREQELAQRIANNRATFQEKKEYIQLQKYLARGNHGGSAGDVNDIVRTMRGNL